MHEPLFYYNSANFCADVAMPDWEPVFEENLVDAAHDVMAEFFDDGGIELKYTEKSIQYLPIMVTVEYACTQWEVSFVEKKTERDRGWAVKRLE